MAALNMPMVFDETTKTTTRPVTSTLNVTIRDLDYDDDDDISDPAAFLQVLLDETTTTTTTTSAPIFNCVPEDPVDFLNQLQHENGANVAAAAADDDFSNPVDFLNQLRHDNNAPPKIPRFNPTFDSNFECLSMPRVLQNLIGPDVDIDWIMLGSEAQFIIEMRQMIGEFENGHDEFTKFFFTVYGRKTCVYCNIAFKSTIMLRNHLYRHLNIRQFKCRLCNISYVQHASLTQHFKRNHSVNENFKHNMVICPVCGKFFFHTEIIRHQYLFHGQILLALIYMTKRNLKEIVTMSSIQ